MLSKLIVSLFALSLLTSGCGGSTDDLEEAGTVPTGVRNVVTERELRKIRRLQRYRSYIR